jgi:putative redox protein
MKSDADACAIPSSAVVSGDLGDGGSLSARTGSVAFPVGAESHGPNPYDLLSTSLAACTLMTIRFQASRMRYSLSHVDVAVAYHHGVGGRDYFDRTIKLEGELDEAQREHLMRAANMCPVGKALNAEIRTRSADAPENPASGGPASYPDDLRELSIPNIDPD